MKLEDYSSHGPMSKDFARMRNQSRLAIDFNNLLWDAYNALDHGSNEERMAILKRLESHFEEFKPDIKKEGN